MPGGGARRSLSYRALNVVLKGRGVLTARGEWGRLFQVQGPPWMNFLCLGPLSSLLPHPSLGEASLVLTSWSSLSTQNVLPLWPNPPYSPKSSLSLASSRQASQPLQPHIFPMSCHPLWVRGRMDGGGLESRRRAGGLIRAETRGFYSRKLPMEPVTERGWEGGTERVPFSSWDPSPIEPRVATESFSTQAPAISPKQHLCGAWYLWYQPK